MSEQLADFILNQKCIYIPYLGKNDHPADILNPISLEGVQTREEGITIHSLMPKDNVELESDFEEEEMEELLFRYEEELPTGLKENVNTYELKKLIYTNQPIKESRVPIYEVESKNIILI